ncbi:MAG: Benzoate--CoA ligase [Pseudomonadota bacterium]
MKQTLSSSIDSSTASSLAPSSHVDTFTRDQFDRPEVQYPEQLNCVQALLDEHVAQGRGDRMAVRGVDATGPMGWTYAQLQTKVNQIAHVLVNDTSACCCAVATAP